MPAGIFVYNFPTVFAHAGPGSTSATLYGSALNEFFVGASGRSYLQSGGYVMHALGFPFVYGVAGRGGKDRATLSGLSCREVFVGTPGWSYLGSPGFLNFVSGFATMRYLSGPYFPLVAFRFSSVTVILPRMMVRLIYPKMQ
jgi:hypothetical protein